MIDDFLHFFFSSSLSLHAHVNPLSGLNEPVFQVKKRCGMLLLVHIVGEKQSKCELT